MPRRQIRRGFSLIELIVVITIIALLIGILLPVLPKVRDAGKRTACAANLRSVGQAVELYKNDFNEVYPVARYMPRPWLSGDTDPAFNDTLAAYMEPNSPAWACPGDKVVADVTYIDEETGAELVSGVSYRYVSILSGFTLETNPLVSRLRFQPTDVPVAHDFDAGTFELEGASADEPGELITVDFFHNTRNLLFADGRVDKYDVGEIPDD
ncbi:MAG: prepilin-type N-terminal cleavage/methylation domain-containing protein [Planctomycetota bacterium]